MALVRGHEVATIDVALVTWLADGETDELIWDTANQIQVEAQTETVEAIKLINQSDARLIAQKPQTSTLTGNQLTMTDNVLIPELLVALQGGTVEYDTSTPPRVISYVPPPSGAPESAKGKKGKLRTYSSIYNAAGDLTGYECITWPNCRGTPIAINTQDNTFRTPEYVVVSSPDTDEPPFRIDYIKPSELPALPVAIIPPTPTDENPNPPVIDKTALLQAIDAAQTVYDAAVVGTDPGQYAQADKDTFGDAIADAEEVNDNAAATQQQVDDAVSALTLAQSTFESSVVV